MSSRVAYRNSFRLVHGQKFWDQTNNSLSTRTFMLFKKFLFLRLKRYLNVYKLIINSFYWLSLGNFFYIYLVAWRGIKSFKRKKHTMKRWRQRIVRHINLTRRWRTAIGYGQKLNINDFYRGHSFWSWVKRNRYYIKMSKKSAQKKRRSTLKIWDAAPSAIKLKKIWFLNRYRKQNAKKLYKKTTSKISTVLSSKNPLTLHKKFLSKQFYLDFIKRVYSALNLTRRKLWKKKKQWLLHLYFQLYLSRELSLHFHQYLMAKKAYKYRMNLRCQIWDFAGFWRTRANQIPSNLAKYNDPPAMLNKQNASPRRFFYRLSKISSNIGPRRRRSIWTSFVLFMYFAKLSNDFNPVFRYIKWMFQAWQRRRQKIFFTFLKRILFGNGYSQYIPFGNYSTFSFYIVFKGRVNGIHRAQSYFMRADNNAKPPFQDISVNVIHYYQQFITRFCSYGVSMWIYPHRFHNTAFPVFKN